MTQPAHNTQLLTEIVDRINLGVLAVDRSGNIVLWNRFMEGYSGLKRDSVCGQNLFTLFPDLPADWLKRKIENVFLLKNFSFTSWEQRPYLFRFPHNRPITANAPEMRQNATFLPVRGESGEVEYVCITLADVTDTSTYETMLKNAVHSLAEASNRDGLTGTFNRRYLEQRLQAEVARTIRYGGKTSFALFDLDFFKAINDNHGHLAGDEALRFAASRLQSLARNVDILGRYGGEEFAFILPETDLEGAEAFANRARELLSAHPCEYGDLSMVITASAGVAQLDENMSSPEDLIEAADSALYQAKASGRNQVIRYQSDMVASAKTVSPDSLEDNRTNTSSQKREQAANDVKWVTVGHK